MSAQLRPSAPRSTLVGFTVTGERIWLTDRNAWTPQKWYDGAHCYIVGGRIVTERTQVAGYLRATKRYTESRTKQTMLAISGKCAFRAGYTSQRIWADLGYAALQLAHGITLNGRPN
jgi:hypothetical protein